MHPFSLAQEFFGLDFCFLPKYGSLSTAWAYCSRESVFLQGELSRKVLDATGKVYCHLPPRRRDLWIRGGWDTC